MDKGTETTSNDELDVDLVRVIKYWGRLHWRLQYRIFFAIWRYMVSRKTLLD